MDAAQRRSENLSKDWICTFCENYHSSLLSARAYVNYRSWATFGYFIRLLDSSNISMFSRLSLQNKFVLNEMY